MATSSGLWTVGYGELGATLKALEDAGVTLGHLARMRSDKDFAQTVGKFIVSGGCMVEALFAPPGVTEYLLQVNYDRSIEDAVKDGNFENDNPDITTQNFPTTRKGKTSVLLRLIRFNRDMYTDEIIAQLDTLGLRSAETHELLALSAAHPELQRECAIAALGSVYQDRLTNRWVPVLPCYQSSHRLAMQWCGHVRSRGMLAATASQLYRNSLKVFDHLTLGSHWNVFRWEPTFLLN